MRRQAAVALLGLADALAWPGAGVLRASLALRAPFLGRVGLAMVRAGRAPGRLAWSLFPAECAAL